MRPVFTWYLGSRSLELGKRTLVMGIVNVTPDSFSDGGEHLTPDAVHILLGGRIVASGGRELADRLEGEGFDAFRTAEVGG